MTDHKPEVAPHQLVKALQSAKAFRQELARAGSDPSAKVSVSAAGTIGDNSETSRTQVTFTGKNPGDAKTAADVTLKLFPGGTCTAEKNKVVTCTWS
jgi:hypothetical protein